MKSKTLRKFVTERDILPLVEEWAKENNFRFQVDEEGGLNCYKIGWVTSAPIFVHIEKREDGYRLEAMLKADAFAQLTNFFTAPPEIALDSGEGLMEWERQGARKLVNTLLKILEIEPIE